jgi:hypothetical protein
MPSPEELKPRNSRNLITFRLNDDDDAALRTLAERVGLGPSTLARRVIEHYVREHAPRNKRK